MALMVADSQAINPHRNAGGSRMSNNIPLVAASPS